MEVNYKMIESITTGWFFNLVSAYNMGIYGSKLSEIALYEILLTFGISFTKIYITPVWIMNMPLCTSKVYTYTKRKNVQIFQIIDKFD